MSLINEALKKAQRDRAPSDSSGVPVPGGGPATSSPSRGLSLKLILGIVVGGAILVGGSIIGTVYLLRKPVSSISIQNEARALPAQQQDPSAKNSPQTEKPSGAAIADADAAAATPAAEAKPTKPSAEQNKGSAPLASKAGQPSPVAEKHSEALPSRDKLIEAPALAVPKIAAAPISHPPAEAASVGTTAKSADTPVASSEKIPSEKQPAPTAASTQKTPPSAAAQAFVNQLKVNGIRAAGADSKVLINDRVYRINDIVDATTSIRLAEVSSERLVFVDAAGNQYVRNF